ncbi:MAG: LPS export ABC transporter ATP-binding protein [Candidatus Marinimicrobia bacterium]|nr:LPS export ABC transporter ATP-binding protein [Candidatus Neomarinimicrobiota bacterium]
MNKLRTTEVDQTDDRILRGASLYRSFSNREVVSDVSLEVHKGEIVGLLGPNGAGKTTTFRMITGMLRPTDGRVYLDDHDITSKQMYKRARLGIGYLSQEPSVFRKLTVEENIMLVLQKMDMSKKERKQRLEELLDELSIKHVRKSKANTLSGGERRRTEITRALVTNPDFILLDEPFVGIDPIAVQDIQNIVKELKQRNIGILITDHNVRETLAITDRAYLMFEGKILKSGTSQFLANDKEAKQLYLGDNFKLDH